MKRVPVTSSNVASIGYDSSTQTLEVEFNDGAIYQYFDVPEAVHDKLMLAASKGEFLHQHIKLVYRYAKT